MAIKIQPLANRIMHRLLRIMETLELSTAYEPASPQIFITGLPRSGTTLISQYAVHRFALAYFTHAAGDWPAAACTVTRWQRLCHKHYVSDFKSQLGKCRGPVAPREAGAFWGMHLGFNDYIQPRDIGAGTCNTVRRTVWRVQNHAHDAPFMNKNVKHLLRLAALRCIFPNAAFIVVERDLAEIAQSLLDARRMLNPDLSHWFSIRPPSYLKLAGLPPLEQVARQIIDAALRMEDDLKALPADRVARLPYGEFCRNPEIVGEIIRRWHPAIATVNAARRDFPLRRREAKNQEMRRLVERVRQLEAECLSGQYVRLSSQTVGERQ